MGKLKTTITKKGQIVIPAEIRQRRQIKPGQQFEVVDKESEIMLIPIKTVTVSKARGWLKLSETTQELLAEARKAENNKEID